MRVIPEAVRQAAQVSTIRFDRVQIIVAVAVPHKQNAITARRPCREVVVLRAARKRLNPMLVAVSEGAKMAAPGGAGKGGDSLPTAPKTGGKPGKRALR